MKNRGNAIRITLGVVFAVVGVAAFYFLGENLGGSGFGTAAIFLAIFAGFLIIRKFGSSSSVDKGVKRD